MRTFIRGLICASTALAVTSVVAQTSLNSDVPYANYCEALSVNAFHVEEMTEETLETIGLSQLDMTVDEINTLSDEEYLAWWSAVLNKAVVTQRFNAGDLVSSRLVNLEGLADFRDEVQGRVQEMCPEAASGSVIEYFLTHYGNVELGIFPAGIDPIVTPSNLHLVGLPYDANGDVDVTHDFWAVELNLSGLGIPLKEGGSVDQAELDGDNMIHMAWVLAADHQWRMQRARNSAEIKAAADFAEELLAIARQNLKPEEAVGE